MKFSRVMTAYCLFGVIGIFVAFGQESHSPNPLRTCPNLQIDIPRDSPVSVGSARFDSYRADSESAVSATNRTSKRATEVLILVEYLNGKDRHILSATYYGHTGNATNPIPSFLKERPILRLRAPIAPGEELYLSATSQIVTAVCPSKARVSKVVLTLEDGTRASSMVPGWSTDPFILEAQNIDVETFPSQVPVDFLASVVVDSKGHATLIKVDHSGNGVGPWLQEQLNKWSIIPAEADSDMEERRFMNLLMRVYPSEQERMEDWSRRVGTRAPFLTLVDVMPPTPSTRKSLVLVGGVLATQHALSDRQ